jgi:TolB-like protein/class 3 adenylate cyclase/Flp pilus assembly protein TadD
MAMSTDTQSDLRPEIAHVLFMDIVEYSRLSINEQSDLIDKLNEIVRGTEQFRTAEAIAKLIRLPTGDGMALVFFNNPEAPARSALEISQALKKHPDIRLRMGIHSGPVREVLDVNNRSNVAGAGIDMARRVMECGDAGHILLSKRVADDLAPYKQWRSYLQELGEIEIKHGETISIFNLHTGEAGNPRLPAKLKKRKQESVGLTALSTSADSSSGRRRGLIIAAVAVAVLLAISFIVFSKRNAPKISKPSAPAVDTSSLGETPIPAKSIAVLPFENLSKDEENAFFAGGVQDEILSNLAKIADLKVISRTSVSKYRSGPERNLREIAKSLGVAHVVEGSVQRAAGRVRVSAQLIDARTDTHLWAEHYDRDIADVFAIQSEIARQIADQLRVKLSPEEKARVTTKPTQSEEAYLVYLQAQDSEARSQSYDEWERIAQLYEKATRIDPSFALAFARLSLLEARLYHSTAKPSSLDKARAAANEAIRLEPALAEAHLALGVVYYWGDRDYERALGELAIAKAGLPNDANALSTIGAIERRQGKWSESSTDLERAAFLNPKDVELWISLAGTYHALRNFSAAIRAFDRGIAADPSAFRARIFRAYVDLDWKGDMTALEGLLVQTPEDVDPNGNATLARFQLKLFQRKYDEALQVLNKSSLNIFFTWSYRGDYLPKSFLLAEAYGLMNDRARARSSFSEAQRIVEAAVRENPTDPRRHAVLGKIFARLGRKEDAVREGKRAVELLPETKDALEGPKIILALAEIYTALGDLDSAFPLLEHSLSSPAGINVPLLKLDPVWDPIRSDPRFEKLLAKFASPSANP